MGASGKQPAFTAATITDNEIRALYAEGLISGADAWNAIYERDAESRLRCANAANALTIDPEEINLVSVEACS